MDRGSPDGALREAGVRFATSPITWAAVGAGVLATAFWLWRTGRLASFVGGIALWSRFDSEDVSDHPKRAKIMALLGAHPGATTADLAELGALNPGTLTYHLEMLARFGAVNSRRVGRERAWYLTTSAKPDFRRVEALAVPARRSLMELIESAPGATQADLARRAGLSPATVHHHLRALVEAGLVTLSRDRNRVKCFPAAAERGPRVHGASFAAAAPIG